MSSSFVDNDLFVDFDEPNSKFDSVGGALSAQQANFFSQSQCVDDDGSLFVVYHASPTEFSAFDPKRVGSGGGSIYGKGFYFCTDTHELSHYGKYIRAFYLNLKNPFIWEACEEDADLTYNLDMFIEVLEKNNFEVTKELQEQLEYELLENYGGLDTIIEQTCGFDFAQKYFIRAGYDGIMNLDIGDFVAFEPNQIKLCSNKTPSNTADIAA